MANEAKLAWAIRNGDGTLRDGTYSSALAAMRHAPGGDWYSVVQVEVRELLASQPDQIEEAAPQEPCGHIAIHTFEDGSEQCKDCLRVWPSETVEAA